MVVEAGHEVLGTAIVDAPEGSHDCACAAELKLVAHAEDFCAVAEAVEAGFAGAEDDKVDVAESPVFDVDEGGRIAVAEEDEGVFGVAVDEGGVGSEVENVVFVHDAFDGVEGEVAIAEGGDVWLAGGEVV